MANENDKVDDIEIPDEEDLEGLDEATDWKLKADELQKKHREAGIRNRERTKALKDRIAELEKNLPKAPEPKIDKKPNEFGLLEKTFLAAKGITADDEVELVKKWMADTGKSVDYVADHAFVKAELETMRTAKANAAATDVKVGDGKDSGAKTDPDYWIGRMTKDAEGNPSFPDDMPRDSSLVAAIGEKLAGLSKSSKEFYNSK